MVRRKGFIHFKSTHVYLRHAVINFDWSCIAWALGLVSSNLTRRVTIERALSLIHRMPQRPHFIQCMKKCHTRTCRSKVILYNCLSSILLYTRGLYLTTADHLGAFSRGRMHKIFYHFTILAEVLKRILQPFDSSFSFLGIKMSQDFFQLDEMGFSWFYNNLQRYGLRRQSYSARVHRNGSKKHLRRPQYENICYYIISRFSRITSQQRFADVDFHWPKSRYLRSGSPLKRQSLTPASIALTAHFTWPSKIASPSSATSISDNLQRP